MSLELSAVTGIKPDKRTYKESSKLIDSRCRIGIEVEVENAANVFRNTHKLTCWTVTEDHSLRNDGAEFVSAVVFGEDIVLALNELEGYIKKNIPKCEVTERCGLHIHVDVSALNTDELLSFIIGYALVEGALFNYVGRDREKSIYCTPFNSSIDILQWLSDIKNNTDAHDIERTFRSFGKYTALNIAPVVRQGSVEFRHHKGTIDTSAIMTWINIIQQIRSASIVRPALELANMVPLDAARYILGPFAHLLDYEGYEDDLLECWFTAKDILNERLIEEEYYRVFMPVGGAPKKQSHSQNRQFQWSLTEVAEVVLTDDIHMEVGDSRPSRSADTTENISRPAPVLRSRPRTSSQLQARPTPNTQHLPMSVRLRLTEEERARINGVRRGGPTHEVLVQRAVDRINQEHSLTIPYPV